MNRLVATGITALFAGLAATAGEKASTEAKGCCADKTAAACADKTATADACADKVATACADTMLTAMRKLEGRWESADADNDGKPDQVAEYKSTAGGSVIIETIFPGQPQEMVTTYHKDGDRMVVTHYCMLGNQPRLRSTDESKDGKFVFAFEGGANINAEVDAYMGGLVFEIVDDNSIKGTWTHFSKGKAGDSVTFDLKRVASKATAKAN